LRPGVDHLHVSLEAKPPVERTPVVLIAMIDVSGSMGGIAREESPGEEVIGLSRLQLVQHALKTIVDTLGDHDQIALVTFSGAATLTLPATRLDSRGKQAVRRAIDQMDADGNTDIWDALRLGLGEAHKFDGRNVNTAMVLFTDGEPNQNPPMGIVPTLNDAVSDTKMEFTISTFGFGYEIDSRLLDDIAKLGHGIYGYCPDYSMVGTIFISFLANSMATIYQHAVLEVTAPRVQATFDLSLLDGSARNVLLEVLHASVLQTVVTFSVPRRGIRVQHKNIAKAAVGDAARLALRDQVYRRKFLALIEGGLGDVPQAPRKVQALFDEIKALSGRTPFLDALAVDLVDPDPNHGQVLKAFQPDFFRKWGQDYLRSLGRFHAVEQRGNFRDQSLQHYAGPKCVEYRTIANRVFVSLPAPRPAFGRDGPRGGWGSDDDLDIGFAPPVRRSASYGSDDDEEPPAMSCMCSDDGAVCFSGDAFVDLRSGTKRVRDLTKGDVLADGGVVECVIEQIEDRHCRAVVLNGVAFSPYHPIQVARKWVFPIEVGDAIPVPIDAWFNLVLAGNKVAVLNGVRAITLGHNLVHDCLAHPYFGTEAILKDLKRYPGYGDGRVIRGHPTTILRDQNGMVIAAY
jgi:hypothetical protein